MSPLLATFVLSWAIWNYRFLLIVASFDSVKSKFQLIDTVAFPTPMSVFVHGVVGPGIATAALIYLYPILALPVFKHWRAQQAALRQERIRIEKDELLTSEEADALRAGIARERSELLARLRALEDENRALAAQAKEHVATQQREETQAMEQHDVPMKTSAAPAPALELENDDAAVLEALVQSGGSEVMDTIRKRVGVTLVKANYHVDRLVSLMLVSRGRQNPDYISLTQQGRAYVVERGLAE